MIELVPLGTLHPAGPVRLLEWFCFGLDRLVFTEQQLLLW